MDTWLENNNRYLEASLAWLRLRLERVRLQNAVEPPSSNSMPAPIVDEPANKQRRFAKWKRRDIKQPVKLLTAGTPPTIDELLDEAAVNRNAAAQSDPPPALQLLADSFGLSEFERDTLLLCASLEFDPGFASLCGLAQHTPARNYPTFALALTLFDDPSWDGLAAHRPLRYSRLIEINQPGPTPLTAAALRADERIVNFIKGLNAVDDRLITLFEPVSAGTSLLSDSQYEVSEALLQRLSGENGDSRPIQLVGVDPGSRLAVAQEICDRIGRRLFRLQLETLPTSPAELETIARLWQREALLLPIGLYIDADSSPHASGEATSSLQKFLSRHLGLVFVAVRESIVQLRNATLTIEVDKPTRLEQAQAWTTLIESLDSETPVAATAKELAGQFDLNITDIRTISTNTIRNRGPKPFSEELWDACRELTETNLDSLAQRLQPKATWDDLVLPDDQTDILRQIAGQVRGRHKVYDEWGFAQRMNRGFGISALFAGETGTGKTMAAEVIANDLQLSLYRIDLSAVISKYIGETEKNLQRLFDAAERGGVILLFDEADALFGKRSEVKDSHDRYANIEVNYLLQRMEAFSGLAILATNMKSALDTAFSRRLRFVVNLPFPSIKERRLIWQKAFPAEMPRKDLDFDRLARLSLSGGNIHSIALNAAFIAAQNGQTVTMPILMNAARAELKKLDKSFSETELRVIGGISA
jgi:predicted nucleic acid-binding protein